MTNSLLKKRPCVYRLHLDRFDNLAPQKDTQWVYIQERALATFGYAREPVDYQTVLAGQPHR